MTAELGLAIFSTIDDAGSLLIEIGKKVNEVRKFKPQCKTLQQDALRMVAVYEKNKDALAGLNMGDDVKQCLKAIDEFVTSCLEWNTLDVGLEVVIHRRLPALRERARGLVDIFTFELAVETFARQRAGFADVLARLPKPGLEERISTQAQAVVRAHMEAEQKILQGKAASITLTNASIIPDFGADDSRLAITFVAQTDTLGRKFAVGRGTLESRGKVVCAKVEVDKYTPSYLKVYRNLQIGAGVQICYGTWASGGGLYAIMEDLAGFPTLHDLCSGKGPRLTPLDKYGIAYNLGQSITSLHGGEICLKYLDDHSVVLKDTGDGKWTPILTGLEQSRLISERTTRRHGHDCRYEAVEYQNTREHFQSTDIWSFGTLIWQLIYEKFPFDLSTAVPQDDTTAGEIRKKLRNGHKPGTLPASGTGADASERAINRLIASCWTSRADIRPTAKDLTRDLQAIYLQSSYHTTLCVSPSTADAPLEQAEADRLRADLAERIKKARELNPPGTGKPIAIPAGLLVEKQDFLTFWGASDPGWDSVASYIAGALFFWGMVKQENEVLGGINGKDAVVADLQEARYNFALKHLLSAAEGGYKEAYHELWRTQAALAWLYRDRYDMFFGRRGGGAAKRK